MSQSRGLSGCVLMAKCEEVVYVALAHFFFSAPIINRWRKSQHSKLSDLVTVPGNHFFLAVRSLC